MTAEDPQVGAPQGSEQRWDLGRSRVVDAVCKAPGFWGVGELPTVARLLQQDDTLLHRAPASFGVRTLAR